MAAQVKPNDKRQDGSSVNEQPPNHLIKKFSIFDRNQAKQAVDLIVEVLDLNVQVEDTDSDRRLHINKLENLNLSSPENPLEKYHCLTCDLKLLSRNDQIDHYKGDLHLFNLKQKMKGRSIVTPEQFEKLTDISSISGSDDDSDPSESSESDLDEDKSSRRTGENSNPMINSRYKVKLMFKLTDSTILSVLKCIIFPRNFTPNNSKEVIDRFKSISGDEKWCIILVAAGHFAAAVFKGDQPILHKTFHRYVVRAKRGTVQSQHDSAGRNARSAGANIRRHQEAAFKDDIRVLIGTEWKSELDQCKCVFIRVPKYNRPVLIGSSSSVSTGAPFERNDPRLRNIPFMTFRPTFNEVKRAHTILSKIEHFDSTYIEFISKFESKSPVVKEAAKSGPKPTHQVKSKQVKQPELKSEESDQSDKSEDEPEVEQQPATDTKSSDFIKSLTGDSLKLFNEIYTCCATNNSAKLQQLFDDRVHLRTSEDPKEAEEQSLLIESLLNKRLNADLGFCLLHLTSQLGHADCVWVLLQNGANPAVSDLTKQRRVPYFLSLNKPTRDTYRRFMSEYPNRYDYTAAKITSPLTAEKIEKEKEKKKAQRKQKKKREAEKKRDAESATKQKDAEEAEKKLFLSLSDQQKRQLIAGRNFFNVMPLNEGKSVAIKVISRCWYCAQDMSTHVPFEYFDYKFCSTKCLNSHRQGQKS